jgi:hypothetical protein
VIYGSPTLQILLAKKGQISLTIRGIKSGQKENKKMIMDSMFGFEKQWQGGVGIVYSSSL